MDTLRTTPSARMSGFTLVETLLYLAIASTILFAIGILLSLVLEAQAKNKAVTEVEQQGAFAMRVITQAIRNAQSVNGPGPGANDTQLSITSANFAANPVVFAFSGGQLTETIGSLESRTLTAPNIKVSNLSFTNLTPAGMPDTIRIHFTLNYVSLSGRQEYNYQADFYDSAVLRK